MIEITVRNKNKSRHYTITSQSASPYEVLPSCIANELGKKKPMTEEDLFNMLDAFYRAGDNYGLSGMQGCFQ
jgi:hypothetical protein